MLSREPHSLKQYIKRANAYGVECVFETAVQRKDLTMDELFELALIIRSIDPKWKMPYKTACELIEALYRAHPESQLKRATGLSTKDFNLVCDLLECRE